MRAAQRNYPLHEYAAIEEMSEIRHEYLDGDIFAMAGGSRNHNRIVKNVSRALDEQLGRGCETHVSDMRVTTPSGLYTYPDVMVVCEPVVLAPELPETIANPIVIVEVLSTSTAEYDRGLKFDLYQSIAGLRDYLLIDQYRIDVEHWTLDAGHWRSRRCTSGTDIVRITGVAASLRVADAYQFVEW